MAKSTHSCDAQDTDENYTMVKTACIKSSATLAMCSLAPSCMNQCVPTGRLSCCKLWYKLCSTSMHQFYFTVTMKKKGPVQPWLDMKTHTATFPPWLLDANVLSHKTVHHSIFFCLLLKCMMPNALQGSCEISLPYTHISRNYCRLTQHFNFQ